MRSKLVAGIITVLLVGTGAYLWFIHRGQAPGDLTLYGNVDLRQSSLAFNDSGRIDAVMVQEGDVIKKGDVIAVLDSSRLAPLLDEARAQLSAQEAVVARLHHGSRPEEIAQARANLAAARADDANARRVHERIKSLEKKSMASIQDVDAAKAAMDVANARVEVASKALQLSIAGPRKEDIAQAEAQLKAIESRVTLLARQLQDAKLVAPVDGIVYARLMEPGEMATPQRPVISLAVTDPKWVRAYVGETNLGRIHSGMAATIKVDAFPGREFSGWIGYISPVSEFTPKTIETEQLRTSLVYEVRVFVKDPNNVLRLGMPATVVLDTRGQSAADSGGG